MGGGIGGCPHQRPYAFPASTSSITQMVRYDTVDRIAGTAAHQPLQASLAWLCSPTMAQTAMALETVPTIDKALRAWHRVSLEDPPEIQSSWVSPLSYKAAQSSVVVGAFWVVLVTTRVHCMRGCGRQRRPQEHATEVQY